MRAAQATIVMGFHRLLNFVGSLLQSGDGLGLADIDGLDRG
jgi:hypothetical protein